VIGVPSSDDRLLRRISWSVACLGSKLDTDEHSAARIGRQSKPVEAFSRDQVQARRVSIHLGTQSDRNGSTAYAVAVDVAAEVPTISIVAYTNP